MKSQKLCSLSSTLLRFHSASELTLVDGKDSERALLTVDDLEIEAVYFSLRLDQCHQPHPEQLISYYCSRLSKSFNHELVCLNYWVHAMG